MVAGGSIILLEIVYKMDFSLVGFIICCLILGFGMLKFSSILFLIARVYKKDMDVICHDSSHMNLSLLYPIFLCFSIFIS